MWLIAMQFYPVEIFFSDILLLTCYCTHMLPLCSAKMPTCNVPTFFQNLRVNPIVPPAPGFRAQECQPEGSFLQNICKNESQVWLHLKSDETLLMVIVSNWIKFDE